MSSKSKGRKSIRSATNFSLIRKGAKFWNALPWKQVNVANENLGEFDESVFLGLEEVDGNAFIMYKKQQEDAQHATEGDNTNGDEVEGESSIAQDKKKKKRKREELSEGTAPIKVEEHAEEDISEIKKSKKNKKKKTAVTVEETANSHESAGEEEEELVPIKSKKNKKEKSADKLEEKAEIQPKKAKNKKANKKTVESVIAVDEEPFDLQSRGNWGGVELNSLLCDSLNALDFVKPTPIQQVAIPKIINNRMDIVGVAETGSGKTLAFGIPILNFLLDNWSTYARSPVPAAMIISPTRELAMQTSTVLNDICKPWKTKAKRADLRINISVAAIVGGMSEHKQKRLLSQAIHILVATPGRLCEIMEDQSLTAFQDLSRLKFLVVDEADRIMEEGHFSELNRVFSRIHDHETLSLKGEDVRTVMWRRNRGISEVNVTESQEEGDEEVLDMGMDDLINLGPTADEISRMIEQQKARGEVCEVPYEEDEDDGYDASAALGEEQVDDEQGQEEEGGDDEDDDDENVDLIDEEEEEEGGDFDNAEEEHEEEVDDEEGQPHMDVVEDEVEEDNVSYDPDNDFPAVSHEEMPDFPALPPFEPYQRQTLLFSATGLSARANLHRNDLAQLKKLKLRGTIVGVASDFLLPVSLKKLFSEVGIQKKIEVIDATRAFKTETDETTGNKTVSKSDSKRDTAGDTVSSTEKSAVTVLPKQLSQFEIRVPAEDKDIYLYSYLVQHPGRRIIVFVNSIKTCRRVDGLLRALHFACKPLHAELPQKTRLQNLDFLKTQPQAILIATDVAARGVDVDRVACVVHYDVARSPQVYIHRSGRTARNGQSGVSLSLVSPDDLHAHQVIAKYLFSYQTNNTPLNTTSGTSSSATQQLTAKAMPVYNVQMLILPALKERVLLARKIFSLSAQQSRASKEAHWAHQQAKDADLLMDGDDMEPDYEVERHEFAALDGDHHDFDGDYQVDPDARGESVVNKNEKKPLSKQAKRELAAMKQQLEALLERPLDSLAGAMRSSTGLILHHHQQQQQQQVAATHSSGQAATRKHGKKARKAKLSATAALAANDWRKRKNGFFVYAR